MFISPFLVVALWAMDCPNPPGSMVQGDDQRQKEHLGGIWEPAVQGNVI